MRVKIGLNEGLRSVLTLALYAGQVWLNSQLPNQVSLPSSNVELRSRGAFDRFHRNHCLRLGKRRSGWWSAAAILSITEGEGVKRGGRIRVGLPPLLTLFDCNFVNTTVSHFLFCP